MHVGAEISTEMRHCIQNCLDCQSVCTELVQHCIDRGGKHAEREHIRLLLDSADICGVSARFMLRHSELHVETCRACAVVCGRCAADCERLADDDMMQRGVEACRLCEESCRSMAGL